MNDLALAIEQVALMAQTMLLVSAGIAAVVIVIYAVVRTP